MSKKKRVGLTGEGFSVEEAKKILEECPSVPQTREERERHLAFLEEMSEARKRARQTEPHTTEPAEVG